MRSVALDFETEAIEGHRPPRPVGLAVAHSLKSGSYYGWGHPGSNNSTRADAKRRLRAVGDGSHDLWFFNAGFDVPVARHLGVALPWERVRDAQILAFLGNPMARSRSLKGLCESELGVAPAERDALYAYIKAHVPEARRLGHKALGAYISQAPCSQVAPYASVDVLDVLRLREHWRSYARGPAWEREHAMLPILARMRQVGIPLDRRGLVRDAARYEGWLVRCEDWLQKRLGIRELKPSLVVEACESLGIADAWYDTPTGGDSLAKEHLVKLVAEGHFHDPAFVQVWAYRAYLAWTLRTFARPWLATGLDAVHPTWNGVLGDEGGAVTGRLSSRPNVQNLPKRIPQFDVPADLGVGPLPNMRAYFKAPAGYTFVGIDISQQELRVLGHFVPSIGDWYRSDPRFDLHTRVRELIASVAHIDMPRDQVKIVSFCRIYGGGANAISEQAGITMERASEFRDAHRDALPGIQRWDDDVLHKSDTYATVGGRTYKSAPGKAYRDKNYAIQGSSADQLKTILVELEPAARSMHGWVPLTAHDEILTCVPTERASEMRSTLTELVESTGVGKRNAMFDVPMLGETYQGKRWVK